MTRRKRISDGSFLRMLVCLRPPPSHEGLLLLLFPLGPFFDFFLPSSTLFPSSLTTFCPLAYVYLRERRLALCWSSVYIYFRLFSVSTFCANLKA